MNSCFHNILMVENALLHSTIPVVSLFNILCHNYGQLIMVHSLNWSTNAMQLPQDHMVYSILYAWFDLKWYYTTFLDLFLIKIRLLLFVFFVTVECSSMWPKHNLITARRSTATCNKHFSLDTCINSLFLQLHKECISLLFLLCPFRIFSNETRS